MSASHPAQGTELVKAWDVVANCGDANLAKLANNIDELDVVVKHLDDIDAAGGYKVWKARSIIHSYKVGDEIAGIAIKQIKVGATDKVVIIGRQMKDHVNKVAEALKAEGKVVEILDDAYLKANYRDDFGFIIDGKKWTVSSAWDDMVNNPKWRQYKENGFVTPEHIDKLPMYKLNKLWIEKVQMEGATIIDMGYPRGVTSSSSFYDMEINLIKWD